MSIPKDFMVFLILMIPEITQAQSLMSIRISPARSTDLQSRRVRILPNGDFVATSVNAISLIDEGYSVPGNPSDRLPELPSWVYIERYDIEAKSAPGTKHAGSPDRDISGSFRGAFRLVLADRFHLVMRTENRTVSVYSLVVARGGPKLKSADPSNCIFDTAQDGCHTFVIGFGHPLNGRAISMDDLVQYLGNWTDMPIVNRTNLSGLYTVSTRGWRPMHLPPPPPGENGNVNFSQLPTLDTVLHELGLELRRQDAAVPFYKVEHIERPRDE